MTKSIRDGSESNVPPSAAAQKIETKSQLSSATVLAQTASFSGLIAFGTVLSNSLFGVSLPAPLSEITVAPAFYLAIAVLYPRRISVWATIIGSAIGETVNLV